MTSARLLSSPSEGHGLTDKITDPTYSALVKGEPAGTIVAIAVLKPVGAGQRETAQGLHRHVAYEAIKLEPVGDSNQESELRYLVQALYEQRTSTGEQRSLPLGIPGQADEERRKALLERIDDHADDQGWTGAQLEEKWREHFGFTEGSEFSYGDRGVLGDYHKAAWAHLLEFAGAIGAMNTPEPEASGEPEPPVQEGEDADTPPEVMVDQIGNDVDGTVTPIKKTTAKKTAAARS